MCRAGPAPFSGCPGISPQGAGVPRYEITVQGQGIAVPVQAACAVGFFRLIQLSARDPVEAQERAVARVKSDWNCGPYALTNRGGPPHLTVTCIGILSWWHRLLGAPQGYIFFSEDGIQMPCGRHPEAADGP